MDQTKSNPDWLQSEQHQDKLTGYFLRDDLPAIEHKPRYLALMELPAQKNKEIEDTL
jgi:hypothetical protein